MSNLAWPVDSEIYEADDFVHANRILEEDASDVPDEYEFLDNVYDPFLEDEI
jgi:hypothetical protein